MYLLKYYKNSYLSYFLMYFFFFFSLAFFSGFLSVYLMDRSRYLLDTKKEYHAYIFHSIKL